MQRRKFLVGMGSLAAGSAAAMGTGAFGSVQASRDVSVDVVSDENALVGLKPATEADYVETTGDTVEFNFDGSQQDIDGTGLNSDARTDFGPELIVTNQGPDPFLLLLDPSDINNSLFPNSDEKALSFYIHTAKMDENGDDIAGGTVTGSPPNTGRQGVILKPGAPVTISGSFKFRDKSPSDIDDATLSVYAVTDESERFPDSGPSDQRPNASASDAGYPRVLDPSDEDDGGSTYGNSEFF